MNSWNERLTRENITDFFNEYAPPAYKSVYRMLGDTARTENVLLYSFVEVYRQRNSGDSEDPVTLFGQILQKRAALIAVKYPLPENYRFSVRSLDEFTQNTLLSDIIHKIDSFSFRAVDVISASSARKLPGGASLPRFGAGVGESGLSIQLIIQLLIVGLIIAGVTYFGAMSGFDVRDSIPDYRITSEQNTDEKLVAALQYLPLRLNANNVFKEVLPAIPSPNQIDESSETSENTTDVTIDGETEISATRG